MGLDSCVKKYLREHVRNSITYHPSPKDVYASRDFCACIIDLNVEFHRKPPHVTTGEAWINYLYSARVNATPGKVLVLVVDNPSRVPEVKDLCHLARAGAKRKRSFIPLPPDTKITDGPLPEWAALSGSRHLMPKIWEYLLRGIKARISNDASFDKTVYFDTCYSSQIKSPFLSGRILKVTSFGGDGVNAPPVPEHKYGEGDLKTRAWVIHCLKLRKSPDDGILIMSVDLDNIPIFAHTKFENVCLMSNTVSRDAHGLVVPKSKGVESAYEIINLGRIATQLAVNTDAFRVLLCLTKNDFNENLHCLTTDRCLKTFFAMISHGTKRLNAEKLLTDPKYYLCFVRMCTSKIYGNRAMKIPLCPRKKIEAFLSRGEWIFQYWSGKQQRSGGPDCRVSGGWVVPTKKMDLKEYSGKVRLIPA